ncbi:MAG: hypothetical protein O2923_02605 [Verrucomicrobia bacterium]|nr:hypothetical protein [Verrucomicrobiota bacterium]MDA1086128.1 hypothetical protein [Verrucomicrobiota bacterium]
MKKKDNLGATIDSGAQDWQIFQQGRDGTADIVLTGRWKTREPYKMAAVLARIVYEDSCESVSPALDWVPATTRKNGTWTLRLRGVPVGGLYRIETMLQLNGGPVEWAQRGDLVHHVGVGDVWVITGQSNAAGYGKSPATDAPEMGVHMFHADGSWKLAAHPLGDSTGTLYSANREGANASHSPWLAFARTLKARLGYPIGLIPASLGGSPVKSWDRTEDGYLFSNMLSYIADAGGGVRGVVWYQGESDTGVRELKLYKGRFRRFVADLRKTMKDRTLPVITCQLNRFININTHTDADAAWERMREIQRQLARSMSNVFIVATVDLGLSDGIHTDSQGNIVIGERAASCALGGVYGFDVKYRHPDCVSAKLVKSKQIDLAFDHVDHRLHYDGQVRSERPFAVRDEIGDIPIDAICVKAPSRIELTLSRKPQRNCRVVGAPTISPARILPFDIRGYRPMLAFTMKVTP